jgi:hypothetical protein
MSDQFTFLPEFELYQQRWKIGTDQIVQPYTGILIELLPMRLNQSLGAILKIEHESKRFAISAAALGLARHCAKVEGCLHIRQASSSQ